MGRLKAGPFYDMIGKTGNNVGRKVRGNNVFSMSPHPSNKIVTTAKKTVQDSLGLVSAFLAPAQAIVNIGYKEKALKQSAMNAAVSANISKGIEGVYPDIKINYAKATFSSGALSMPANATMAVTNSGKIDVRWSSVLENTVGSLRDKAMLLIYNEDQDDYQVGMDVALRADQAFEQHVPDSWSGDRAHGYLFFISQDNKLVSDTAYLGTLELL